MSSVRLSGWQYIDIYCRIVETLYSSGVGRVRNRKKEGKEEAKSEREREAERTCYSR